jgi:hypothetical protein
MSSSKLQKTSSNVSLHLSYFAAEITLHRAIILFLNRSRCEGTIVDVCRNAARERVITATEFVKSLKVNQLQSFWYFGVFTLSILQVHLLTSAEVASGMNLVYIGTLTALLFLTSKTVKEATFYKDLLKDYRWTLRVTSRAATFIDFAVRQLDTSLIHVDQLLPKDIVCDEFDLSKESHEHNENETEDTDGELNEAGAIGVADANTSGQQSMLPKPQSQLQEGSGDEQQQLFSVLEASEFNPALSNQIVSEEMLAGPDYFGRDWSEFAGADSFLALDLSPS